MPDEFPPTDDDMEAPENSNVIQFKPEGLPIWDKLPDRFVEVDGRRFKLCRLPFCDKPLNSKGLCDPHYKYMRQGRLDPTTGGMTYMTRGPKELTPPQEMQALRNMGDLKDWVYIGQLKEFVNIKDFQRINLQAAIEMDGQVVRALIRNQKFKVFRGQEFRVYNQAALERTIDQEGNHAQPPTTLGYFNTFLPSRMMWPKAHADKLNSKLNELLSSLAPEAGDRYYLEQWLSYLVRNPGQTGSALILQGIQGSGKGTLMDLLNAIYGAYARTIQNKDLENDFNSWLEEKLLICGEEMSSGNVNNKTKVMNALKHYVSGKSMTINRKGVPQYTSYICARWILFSNAKKPLIMEPSERRYSVIKSLNKLPPALGDELSNGAQHFAQELLNYLYSVDIEDMSPWEILDNDALKEVKARSEEHFANE